MDTETSAKAKGKVRDSVFTHLFGIRKYMLMLYKALHPEDSEADDENMENITIDNVLVSGFYNDLGILVRDKLIILVEAQSTPSPNILIRFMMYLLETYEKYLYERRINLHSSKKADLPKPELYLIYTGKPKPEKDFLSLREEYFGGEESGLELNARVICDSKEGDIINQYVSFTRIYTEQIKKYKDPKKAILATIEICKDENILREYLTEHEREVKRVMISILSEEYARERDLEDSRAEGEAKGIKNTLEALAEKFRRRGMNESEIEDLLALG